VVVNGVVEVAICGGDTAQSPIRSSEGPVDAVDDSLDAGRSAVDVREGLDDRVRPAPPILRGDRAEHTRSGAHLRHDRLRITAAFDEHVERLHNTGADAGVGKRLTAGDGVTGAGKVLQL